MYGLTGCSFAASLFKKERRTGHVAVLDNLNLDDLEASIASAARRDGVSMPVFTGVRSESDLVSLITTLCTAARWRGSIHSQTVQDGTFLFHLEYRTDSSYWSSVMGFAPLLTMPVPRRLPFVAFVFWPGDQTKSSGDTVDFHDIQHDFSAKQFDNMKAKTEETVGRLFDFKTNVWRKVTFALPERLRGDVQSAIS